MGKKHPLDSGQVFQSSAKKTKSKASASSNRIYTFETDYFGNTERTDNNRLEDINRDQVSDVIQSSLSLATRFAQTAQLCSEIFGDPKIKAEFTTLAGQDITKAALKIGQVLCSKQLVVSSSGSSLVKAESSSELAKIPNVIPHLENLDIALPELPPISDASLAKVPFTHRYSAEKEGHCAGVESYERLEFLGDAYVELISSRLIYQKYPDLPPGRLSQIRESLVRNETLGSFALAYKFDERIDLPSSYMEGRGAPRKLLIKTFGDIFEAYVAAVIVSDQQNGFATAEAWLVQLWTPRLPGNEDYEAPKNKFAKQDLAKKIMGKGVKLEYKVEEEQVIKKEGKIWYTVGAYLTGWGWEDCHLGSGKALSTGEAGTRAAMQALVSPLTAQISAIKREHDAKVKLEREQQAVTTSSELE
ncbi:hypothetical protein MMC18_004319 [Xylographa bjoerkii]|nr:hypothetical protein [Xylographa bjoerkii]